MSTITRTHEPYLVDLCQRAIKALDEGIKAPPGQEVEPIGKAERTVNQLRDALIERLRQDPVEEDFAPLRANLENVNASLSLLVGVEFPAGAIHRKKLVEARRVLKRVKKTFP